MSHSGKESGGGGVAWAEAVLGRGGGEGGEEGQDTAFKNLRGGAKERDGAVGSRDGGRFIGFRDREDEGLLPNRGEVRRLEGMVKEEGEV